MASELTVTGYHGCSNMLREFSLRAAAIFLAAAAAVLTLSACGDKATDSKETLPAATVATATQAADTTQIVSTAPATQPPVQKQETGTTNAQQRQADNDSKANNAQSSAADNAGETSRGSYQSSSGNSTNSSSQTPGSTVVINDGKNEIVLEQGENELPFIPS